MTVTLGEFTEDFTPEQKARVAARTPELIEEQLTLRNLRQAQHLTQERMAELMGVEQENVSRLERRADLLLSLLSGYRGHGGQAAAGGVVSEPASGGDCPCGHYRAGAVQAASSGPPRQGAKITQAFEDGTVPNHLTSTAEWPV